MKRIAIDIPIGYGPRQADALARERRRRQLGVLDPGARAVRRAVRRGRRHLGAGARARRQDPPRHRARRGRPALPRGAPGALLHGDERHAAAQVPQEVGRRRVRAARPAAQARDQHRPGHARRLPRRSRSTTCSTLRRARGPLRAAMPCRCPTRRSGATGSAPRSGTSRRRRRGRAEPNLRGVVASGSALHNAVGSVTRHLPWEASLCLHAARSRFCSLSRALSSSSHPPMAGRRAGTLSRRPTRSWSGWPRARASTRARSTRPPGSSSSSCARSRTARTSSSCRSGTGATRVRGDHRQARCAWRCPLGRARRAHAAAVGPDRPELGSGSGTCSPPPRATTGSTFPARATSRSARPSITIGVIDTGYRPHVDLDRPLRRRLRLHRRHPRRERRQRPRRRCAAIRATGSRAPRTRAATSRLRRVGNSSWHGTHVSGTIGAVSEQRHRRSPGSTRSRRSSRCGCSASAAATRATSPTRSAGRPDLPVSGVPTQPDAGPRRQHQPRRQRRLRLDHPERDQRRRRGGHGRRRRRGQQQRATPRTSPRPTAPT